MSASVEDPDRASKTAQVGKNLIQLLYFRAMRARMMSPTRMAAGYRISSSVCACGASVSANCSCTDAFCSRAAVRSFSVAARILCAPRACRAIPSEARHSLRVLPAGRPVCRLPPTAREGQAAAERSGSRARSAGRAPPRVPSRQRRFARESASLPPVPRVSPHVRSAVIAE